MPSLDFITKNLIKMYFNINSMIGKNSKFKRRRRKLLRNSANKVFVGNTEMKHFNNKVIITIYIYNRTKKYIFKFLEKLYRKIFNRNFFFIDTIKDLSKDTIKFYSKNNNFYINNIIKNRYKKFLNRKLKLRFKIRKNKKGLNFVKIRKFYLVKSYKSLYLNSIINYGIVNYKNNDVNNKPINLNSIYLNLKLLSIYNKSSMFLKKFLYRSNSIVKLLKEKNFIQINKLINKKGFFKLKKDYLIMNKKFIKSKFWKERLYLKYSQMFAISCFKYTNIYLNNLKKTIERIYMKKIEFNIINLKYLHLDSNIFSTFISIKIKNRKNNLMRLLNRSLALPRVSLSKKFLFNIHNLYINKHNELNLFYIDKKLDMWNNKNKYNIDMLQGLLNNIFNFDEKKTVINILDLEKNKQKFIYKSVRFRKIVGVRLEAKGRLTRRLTAARAIFKLRYRGNLQNIDSVNNLSSILMRGYLKSNLDYTNINYKTRNGSFGLKGWINTK